MESSEITSPNISKIRTIWVFIFVNLLLMVAIVGFSYWNIDKIKEFSFRFFDFPDPIHYIKSDSIRVKKQIVEIQKRIELHNRKLESFIPNEPFMIINTTTNSFVLRTRKKIIREGVVSTGSYTQLETEDGKKWIFKTPKGQFKIQGKVEDPLWIKPDWAYIEEGLPVPPKNHPDRYQYGTLGDYALSLGKGYFIHGTLYQRYLGLPVTHGCVRMGDEDLKIVYKSLEIGSKVYIY